MLDSAILHGTPVLENTEKSQIFFLLYFLQTGSTVTSTDNNFILLQLFLQYRMAVDI